MGGLFTLPQDAVNPSIQGLVIDRRRFRLGFVEDFEGQDFLAVEQFDAPVWVLHDGHALSTQGIARSAVGLENVALLVERQHQVFGERAPVMQGADACQPVRCASLSGVPA